MTEEEFLKDVLALCRHPKSDTPTGTFYEVVSYLEGYGKGHAVVKNHHSVFTPFRRWFSNKLGQKPSEIPINWTTFRELFSSDEEAFENLSVSYEEYVYLSNQIVRENE